VIYRVYEASVQRALGFLLPHLRCTDDCFFLLGVSNCSVTNMS
jgi:hypothetical protein